jgi:hypothetical protein
MTRLSPSNPLDASQILHVTTEPTSARGIVTRWLIPQAEDTEQNIKQPPRHQDSKISDICLPFSPMHK